MAKRISSSHLRSKIRQIQTKQKQAINKFERDVNKAINDYNQKVRAHNSHVRSNRQRIIAKLKIESTTTITTRYTVLRSSVLTLNEAYTRLEEEASHRQLSPIQELILNLSERENANSLEVMNALLGDTTDAEEL